MRDEVSSAVEFLTVILKSRNVDIKAVDSFRDSLILLLCTHYENHWFPEKPFKGSGYRCLRIVNRKMDPIIQQAGAKSGLSTSQLLSLFPAEFTLWIDPTEVSYRIGEDGSIGVLYPDESSSSDSEVDSSDESLTHQYNSPEYYNQNYHGNMEYYYNHQQVAQDHSQEYSHASKNHYWGGNSLVSSAQEAFSNFEYLAPFVAS